MWPDPAQNDANIIWVRDYYKDDYPRLVEVERKWDPDNLFRVNQNIRP